MKRIALLTLMLAVVSPLFQTVADGQVVANPQVIRGTGRFTNVDPVVLGILGAPGNLGLAGFAVYASTVPPAPLLTASAVVAGNGRISSPYEITVESDPAGYAYQVSLRGSMGDGSGEYYFASRNAPSVTPGGGPVTLNFAECAGVVRVRFVNSLGVPVAISGGSVRAYHEPESHPLIPQSQRTGLPSGITETMLIVRAGGPMTIGATVQLGSRTDTDRLQFQSTTNLNIVCDMVHTVSVVVPPSATLGRMFGTVDVAGEFELAVDGLDALDYADYTSVIADNGPYENKRYAVVPGVNFTAPASGPFQLQNLLPDSAQPGSDGYSVYAQAFFRTNYRFSSLYTPSLGAGSNPPVTVSSGASINLSNLFQITPGYIRGRVRYDGPPEAPGAPSMLRGILRAGDGDLHADGIPDGAGAYGVYWSSVTALGVNRRASGADYTAARGYAATSFEGAFNPVTASFEGDYELVVGGLKSQRSIWKQQTVGLTLSGGRAADGTYYYNTGSLTDQAPAEHEIGAGESASSEVACCFGELFIQFKSSSGLFHTPQVRFSSGSFSGSDFLGRSVNYQFYIDAAFGAPFDANAPTNQGYVRLLLPQGRYSLNAYVVPAGTSGALTQVDRFDVEIGCRQVIRIEQCLQLTLDAPSCVDTPTPNLRGRVRSCTKVDRITYRIDDGPEIDICKGCGIDPTFEFTPELRIRPCQSAALTVTAYDVDGAVSSVATRLRYDDSPPKIECPPDLAVQCVAGTNGVAVKYSVSAKDECEGAVTVTCSPPSGSFFPVGSHEVVCVARDACGNTSRCTFKVVVSGDDLTIERAVILRWTCGVLQCADTPEGPYVDVPGATSPYCVPADRARKLYKVRP